MTFGINWTLFSKYSYRLFSSTSAKVAHLLVYRSLSLKGTTSDELDRIDVVAWKEIGSKNRGATQYPFNTITVFIVHRMSSTFCEMSIVSWHGKAMSLNTLSLAPLFRFGLAVKFEANFKAIFRAFCICCCIRAY